MKPLKKVELGEVYFWVSSLSPWLRGQDVLRARITKGVCSWYRVHSVNDIDKDGKLIKTEQSMIEFTNMTWAYFYPFKDEKSAKKFISDSIQLEDRTIHKGIAAVDSVMARINPEHAQKLEKAVHEDAVSRMVEMDPELEVVGIDAAIDAANVIKK